jgi:hypothetical protein
VSELVEDEIGRCSPLKWGRESVHTQGSLAQRAQHREGSFVPLLTRYVSLEPRQGE